MLAASKRVCYTQGRELRDRIALVTAARRGSRHILLGNGSGRPCSKWARLHNTARYCCIVHRKRRGQIAALERKHLCEMERHRTMRAYSAGGVVFRLVPQRSTEDSHTTDKQSDGRDIRD